MYVWVCIEWEKSIHEAVNVGQTWWRGVIEKKQFILAVQCNFLAFFVITISGVFSLVILLSLSLIVPLSTNTLHSSMSSFFLHKTHIRHLFIKNKYLNCLIIIIIYIYIQIFIVGYYEPSWFNSCSGQNKCKHLVLIIET